MIERVRGGECEQIYLAAGGPGGRPGQGRAAAGRLGRCADGNRHRTFGACGCLWYLSRFSFCSQEAKRLTLSNSKRKECLAESERLGSEDLTILSVTRNIWRVMEDMTKCQSLISFPRIRSSRGKSLSSFCRGGGSSPLALPNPTSCDTSPQGGSAGSSAESTSVLARERRRIARRWISSWSRAAWRPTRSSPIIPPWRRMGTRKACSSGCISSPRPKPSR